MSNARKLGDKGPDSSIVQIVNTQTGAMATGTTAIPYDDTIPQQTEGTQFMSVSITPKSATNILKIDVVVCFESTSANYVCHVLFQDSTANAIAAAQNYVGSSGVPITTTFTHYMTAGTTSATTFKYRGGNGSATTFTFNGQQSVRRFGGVMASSITITEIRA